LIENILHKNIMEQTEQEKLEVLKFKYSIDDLDSEYTFYTLRLKVMQLKSVMSSYELKYLLLFMVTSFVGFILNFFPLYCIFLLDIIVSSPI
jgi:hypothetical protein